MQSGKMAKQRYGYVKNGSCALFATIDLDGQAVGHVFEQRNKKGYASLFKALAAVRLNAGEIGEVQNNLNIHSASSFYEYQPKRPLSYNSAPYFTTHPKPPRGST